MFSNEVRLKNIVDRRPTSFRQTYRHPTTTRVGHGSIIIAKSVCWDFAMRIEIMLPPWLWKNILCLYNGYTYGTRRLRRILPYQTKNINSLPFRLSLFLLMRTMTSRNIYQYDTIWTVVSNRYEKLTKKPLRFG